MKEAISELAASLSSLSPEEGMRKVAGLYPGKVKFSSSLGQEDQVITDMIARHALDISVFTLDTGRLFNETYELIEKTAWRYKIKIDICFPEKEAVEDMVRKHGINLFYHSVEERKLCCGIRKVQPLDRALEGASVWITGLRSSQNHFRSHLPVAEWLPDKNIIKYNPLLHWSYEEVMNYIRLYEVPYNPLHDKGFVSIGCAPCTRAVASGEDPRAGRWWWEDSHKECGLHIHKPSDK